MIKNSRYNDIVISIIQPSGNVVDVKRIGTERNHSEVFLRAEKEIPDLLENFRIDPQKSGGFDFASYVAACNNIVIWPTNVNDNDTMLISLPEIPTIAQCKQLKRLIKELQQTELYVMVCSFKKRNFGKIKTISLSGSGDFFQAYEKTIEFINKVEGLSTMLEESEQAEIDVSEYTTIK